MLAVQRNGMRSGEKMDNKKFLEEALKVDRPTYDDIAERLQDRKALRLLHAQIGLSGEVGELADAIKKNVMYGKPLDITNLKEECGDVLWYMAILLDEIGSSFDEVMAINDAKLKVRYPNGYTDKNASLRLDKKGE